MAGTEREITEDDVDLSLVPEGGFEALCTNYCADHGTFIVENVCNLASVLKGKQSASF